MIDRMKIFDYEYVLSFCQDIPSEFYDYKKYLIHISTFNFENRLQESKCAISLNKFLYNLHLDQNIKRKHALLLALELYSTEVSEQLSEVIGDYLYDLCGLEYHKIDQKFIDDPKDLTEEKLIDYVNSISWLYN